MSNDFDSELDGRIRSFLGRLDDASPMAPPLSSLRRTHASPPLRRVGVAAVSLAVVGAGAAGVVALRPDPSAAPGAPVSTSEASDVSAPIVVDTPATSTAPDPDSSEAVASGRSAESFIGDDSFLLANLNTMLGVGTAAERDTAFSFNRPEDEVADCMVEGGWQYEPDPQLDPRDGLSAEEFASQYGFGVVSYPPDQESPNEDYLATLSAEQQQAYHWALFDCQDRNPDSPRRRFTDAWSVAFDQFREEIGADDRGVDATETWAQCMASAGFPYDSPNAMRESFYSRMNSMSGDELEQLAVEERATAVANVPCEAEFDEVYRDVIADRFDEFKSLLVAAWESGDEPDAQG